MQVDPGQHLGQRRAADRISLVISDVDGTLVTTEKQLTGASIAAVRALREAGAAFTVVSSRPPRGLAMIATALDLHGPFAAFNGAAILRADFSVIEEHLVPPEAARRAVATMSAHGVTVWVFSEGQWLLTDPAAAYVPMERRAIQFEPTVVPELGPWIGRAGKIVGASPDFDLVARCERELQQALDGSASVRRSQRYYLDVTHPIADKGHAVRRLAECFGVPLAEMAVLGDMANDLPMFAEAGLAIAMGNASPEVQASAQFVTGSNQHDGFAAAIERIVLPRVQRGAPT